MDDEVRLPQGACFFVCSIDLDNALRKIYYD